jgi:YihY family inner membrane protein
MSSATTVPETRGLGSDDALDALRRSGWGRLARDSFARFRAGDGFSHSRALGYQITLTALSGLIATVGLATALDQEGFRRLLRDTLLEIAPGPAGSVLTQAFAQGSSGGSAALWAGLLAALISGTIAMGLVERGANRIYGMDEDRPARDKYVLAAVLACTAGLLMLLAFVLFIMGSAIGEAGKGAGWSDRLVAVWKVARWPVGFVFITVAFALLLQKSPRRRQPSASWLVVGAGLAALLWVAFTLLLSAYLALSKSFGQTYGPLSGIIGLLLWAYLSSLAVFLGIAFAAELEAIRAGYARSARG